MKVSEKKAKRVEDVRGLILNAAKKLFVQEGYHSTSIRKIASAIGYSPTTIYLYYEDKADIVYALHKEGFAMLKMMFTSLLTVESPFERLKALGKTYLHFAIEHPDYYQVMFILKDPMDYLDARYTDECWEEGKQTFGLLVSTVEECQRTGYFINEDPELFALQAWALVHGLSSLFLTSRLQKVCTDDKIGDSGENLLESVFKTYIKFLEYTKNI